MANLLIKNFNNKLLRFNDFKTCDASGISICSDYDNYSYNIPGFINYCNYTLVYYYTMFNLVYNNNTNEFPQYVIADINDYVVDDNFETMLSNNDSSYARNFSSIYENNKFIRLGNDCRKLISTAPTTLVGVSGLSVRISKNSFINIINSAWAGGLYITDLEIIYFVEFCNCTFEGQIADVANSEYLTNTYDINYCHAIFDTFHTSSHDDYSVAIHYPFVNSPSSNVVMKILICIIPRHVSGNLNLTLNDFGNTITCSGLANGGNSHTSASGPVVLYRRKIRYRDQYVTSGNFPTSNDGYRDIEGYCLLFEAYPDESNKATISVSDVSNAGCLDLNFQ